MLDQPPYEPVTGIQVTGSSDSPSTELLAAWLQQQLEVPVTLDITNPVRRHQRHPRRPARARRAARSTWSALQPNVATLTQPNQPTHDISLPRRNLRDCLAEELRRLDPDDLFGEVVQNGLGALSAPAEKNRSRPGKDKGPKSRSKA